MLLTNEIQALQHLWKECVGHLGKLSKNNLFGHSPVIRGCRIYQLYFLQRGKTLPNECPGDTKLSGESRVLEL